MYDSEEGNSGLLLKRLKLTAEYINSNYDIDDLCKAFPKCARPLRDEEGRRIKP